MPVRTDFSNIPLYQRVSRRSAEKVAWKSRLTQCPPNEAEEQSEANEGPVPLVVFPHRRHSHEHKNQGLADAAQHLHEIFYCGIGILGNILLHVFFHCHCTCCHPVPGKTSETSYELFFFSFKNNHSLHYLHSPSPASDLPNIKKHFISSVTLAISLDRRACAFGFTNPFCIQEKGSKAVSLPHEEVRISHSSSKSILSWMPSPQPPSTKYLSLKQRAGRFCTSLRMGRLEGPTCLLVFFFFEEVVVGEHGGQGQSSWRLTDRARVSFSDSPPSAERNSVILQRCPSPLVVTQGVGNVPNEAKGWFPSLCC